MHRILIKLTLVAAMLAATSAHSATADQAELNE